MSDLVLLVLGYQADMRGRLGIDLQLTSPLILELPSCDNTGEEPLCGRQAVICSIRLECNKEAFISFDKV